MEPERAGGPTAGPLDVGCAETGLALLIEASERAVEELGLSVPPAQIRALLIIDRAGSLNLSRLAESLGASPSAASRLCDRIQAAGLLTRDRAPASRREIVLFPTESGRRLAEWVRARRRAALDNALQAMSPEGRDALAQGLRELAVGTVARISAASRRPPRGRAVTVGRHAAAPLPVCDLGLPGTPKHESLSSWKHFLWRKYPSRRALSIRPPRLRWRAGCSRTWAGSTTASSCASSIPCP